MALIHETLYKTRNFSHVDMSVYLTTLVGQIAGTYLSQKSIRTTVNAEGLSLDLARATPCGLIVNELVTNCSSMRFPNRSIAKVPGANPARSGSASRSLMECIHSLLRITGSDYRQRLTLQMRNRSASSW